ncbi:MAG TPA: hypothetical protein VEI06_13360 [Gemmatimonadaceae bacterium]|nr:hypothetical protein [Gemmatimonadaceae bacterium]
MPVRSSTAVLAIGVAALLAAGCERRAPASRQASVPLYDNLGAHHRPVTATPDAQRYFDQGLRLVYAFNHDEAIASFAEGARRDPRCAMCWWGVALALGPNINAAMEDSAVDDAVEAVRRAREAAPGATPVEVDLISALAARYSLEAGASRAALDTQYADAMRRVAARHPGDGDAETLFAEALMDVQPWNYWTLGGQPKGRIEEIITTLEGVLAREPDHPGACHYYIHAVEASLAPQRAVRCAERLAELMPGAGHIVHMPAHIYMRLGRYEEATRHNEHALSADATYMERRSLGPANEMYHAHNFHFLSSALAMQGRGAAAIRAARQASDAMPLGTIRAYPAYEVYVTPHLFLEARFGMWNDLLREAPPPPELGYSTAIWRYARGVASARTGQLAAARRELAAVTAAADSAPTDQGIGINSAKALLDIAQLELAAEVELAEHRPAFAAALLRQAIEREDALTYDEPAPWPNPLRQTLGRLLLDAGQSPEAAAVFRDDLLHNPENGWSLTGLAEALRRLGKRDEAAAVAERARKAWANADAAPPAS